MPKKKKTRKDKGVKITDNVCAICAELYSVHRKVGGRCTKKTEKTLKLLEEAYDADMSTAKAVKYANITEETYYKWIREDLGFAERMRVAKMKNRITIGKRAVKGAKTDPNLALKYLEKKHADEYSGSPQTQVESTVNVINTTSLADEAKKRSQKWKERIDL